MDENIGRYLNDHLAGSSAALPLIQELAESHGAPGARTFFLHLKEQVESDRLLLGDLLERIGRNPGALLRMAGGVAARMVGIKLMWERIEPGELGLFEGLELLALGVEGKRLLWVTLREISAWFPEWNGIDFRELELQATRQRDNIEVWRIRAAADVHADAERRNKIELK